MLINYFVIHSTVTKLNLCRLFYIHQLKIIIMRTLNSNQVTETLHTTKSNAWNSKRRYR
jgi:hypothetical protein